MKTLNWSALFISLLGLQLVSSKDLKVNRGVDSCLRFKRINPRAASAFYTIHTRCLKPIQVYCEMGLNGGGYTFLSPSALTVLTSADLSAMFTDRATFLLRVRKTDGTQPYAVLKQLPQYASIPLKLGLNEYNEYNGPINVRSIGSPFLYFGFLPIRNASNNNIQGLQVNGFSDIFRNCDKNPNSHFTLYPNFAEVSPSSYIVPGAFCDQIFSHLAANPSGRVMPPGMFLFGETHWGGCGCYKQTNQIPHVLGFSIGFR